MLQADQSKGPLFPARPIPHTIRGMNGLMMDYPLTLSTIFRRAESLLAGHEIVWHVAAGTPSRQTRELG